MEGARNLNSNYWQLKKGLIKNLPVWEDVEKILDKLKRNNDLMNKLIEIDEQMENDLDELANLNNSKDLKITVYNEEDDVDRKDIIKEYVITETGEYQDIKEAEIDWVQESKKRLESSIFQYEEVFAMINPSKPWVKCQVICLHMKRINKDKSKSYYSAEFELKVLTNEEIIRVGKYAVARLQDHGDHLQPPKRVIAGTTHDNLRPGTIIFEPSRENSDRYLVIMDNNSASYFNHAQIFPIVGQSKFPWQDPLIRLKTGTRFNEFYLRYDISNFPRRDLLYLDESCLGKSFAVYRDGQLIPSTVIGIDCDTFKIRYQDNTEDSIYRGSLRVKHREHRNLIPTDRPNLSFDDNFVGKMFFKVQLNCKEYYEAGCKSTGEDVYQRSEDFGDFLVSLPGRRDLMESPESPKRIKVSIDEVAEEQIIDLSDEDLDNDKQHKCTPECLSAREGRNEASIGDIIDEFRNVCDLKVPLLLGWKHEVRETKTRTTIKREPVYEAPCGKRFKKLYFLKNFLLRTKSKLDIDYFTDQPDVDLHRTRPAISAYWQDPNIARDRRTNRPLENKFVMAINQCNEEPLPFDFTYHAKSFLHPRLSAYGMTLNEEFKSGCDCEDDCQNVATCACHKLTVENNRLINDDERNANLLKYTYKRRMGLIRTGIFECNSFCKCSSRCPNRVVSNGIRFRFQVHRTPDKGWGLITLDDIPEGAFVCTYAAEILDDADRYSNDDMYFADMDYITIMEQSKLGDGNGNNKKSKKSIKEFLNLEQDFTLDARINGNIGRFCNHSCDPNCYIQNVFTDTHDIRFPTPALFSHRTIKAMEEITWDYGYKPGSIPNRRIDCNCRSENCRGRIL